MKRLRSQKAVEVENDERSWAEIRQH